MWPEGNRRFLLLDLRDPEGRWTLLHPPELLQVGAASAAATNATPNSWRRLREEASSWRHTPSQRVRQVSAARPALPFKQAPRAAEPEGA